MNGRRGFLKSLVGAFVASAIDLRMAREPELAQVKGVAFDPKAYMGEFQWLNIAVQEVWTERYRAAYTEMAENLPKCLDNPTPI